MKKAFLKIILLACSFILLMKSVNEEVFFVNTSQNTNMNNLTDLQFTNSPTK